jgi:hypothetical protein
MLRKLKYIAAYQTLPVSAITHVAPIERFEPYGCSGKYRAVFGESARPVGPIVLGCAPAGSIQGPRYTSLKRLLDAKSVTDIFV